MFAPKVPRLIKGAYNKTGLTMKPFFTFFILNLVDNVQRFSLTPLPFCVCSGCTKLQRTSLYFGFRWPCQRHQRSVGLSAQQQSVLQCCHEHRRGHTYLDSKNIHIYREVGTSVATLIWNFNFYYFKARNVSLNRLYSRQRFERMFFF